MGNSFFNPFMVGPDFASGINDMVDSILYGKALGSDSGGNDMSGFYQMLNYGGGGGAGATMGAGGGAQAFQNPMQTSTQSVPSGASLGQTPLGGGQGGLSPQMIQLLMRWINGGVGTPSRSY